MNIEEERRGKWAVLLSNCASRHVTLYRFHQIQVSLISYSFLIDNWVVNWPIIQSRKVRDTRNNYMAQYRVIQTIFFSPLVFANLWFFVPNLIFLRKWRQWRSVTRTLKSWCYPGPHSKGCNLTGWASKPIHVLPVALTVFDLITAHTPISAQSSNSVYFSIKAFIVGTHLTSQCNSNEYTQQMLL